MMTEVQRRNVKIFKAACAGIIVALWCALFLGCGTIGPELAKINWPKPTIIFTTDNSTRTNAVPPVVVGPSKPEEKPDVPAAVLPVNEEAAQGFSHDAQIDGELVFRDIDGGGWHFKLSKLNWKIGGPIGDGQGECWMGVKRDGKWRICKYDHFRASHTGGGAGGYKDFKNIYEDYQMWADVHPVRGEVVCLFMINYDHNRRSNAVFCNWVGN